MPMAFQMTQQANGVITLIDLAYAAAKVQEKLGKCLAVEVYLEQYKTRHDKNDLLQMLRLVRANVIQHECNSEEEALWLDVAYDQINEAMKKVQSS